MKMMSNKYEILGKLNKKFENKEMKKKDFIEGEFEDIEDDNDRKI